MGDPDTAVRAKDDLDKLKKAVDALAKAKDEAAKKKAAEAVVDAKMSLLGDFTWFGGVGANKFYEPLFQIDRLIDDYSVTTNWAGDIDKWKADLHDLLQARDDDGESMKKYKKAADDALKDLNTKIKGQKKYNKKIADAAREAKREFLKKLGYIGYAQFEVLYWPLAAIDNNLDDPAEVSKQFDELMKKYREAEKKEKEKEKK